MPRKKSDDSVKAPLLDEKKLTTVMKKFLGTNKSDPEITKYFRIEDGLHFMATSIGSAVWIHFENKFAGSFNKKSGNSFFRKILPKGVFIDVDGIPEMESVKEGKKTVERPTGRILEYPDIPGMFAKYNLDEFNKLTVPNEDIEVFVGIHKAMSNVSKIGGLYNTANIRIENKKLTLSLHDSPVKFEWSYDIESDFHFEYRYDFDLMSSIFESLKDMKVEEVDVYVKNEDSPIIFCGKTLEYQFKFAINRKLTQ